MLALALAPGMAAADGERSPMVGGAAVAAVANEDALAGAQLEVTSWHWRLGLAAEGSMLWSTDEHARHAAVLGVSARVLVFDGLVQSWIEPRDVELGIELHAIVERAWWIETDPNTAPVRYGVGVALRVRGGGEYDVSNLLAESRLFVRIMKWPPAGDTAIARAVSPPMATSHGVEDLLFMVGIGASFGTGEPDYVQRFRAWFE